MSIALSKKEGIFLHLEMLIDMAGKSKPVSRHVFTTKSSDSGTGLGLSAPLGITQKHGGEIRVGSTVGEGSIFAVILPAE